MEFNTSKSPTRGVHFEEEFDKSQEHFFELAFEALEAQKNIP